ncbi:MAG: EamA family transporter [Patescibacteria group bacterium]|jgi:drug/metabolite transporter (DMT)-like permease
MLWLIIIVIAYFLNASATAIDKFLLSKKISNPAVYAFFISALSVLGIVLIPFGFHAISLWQIVVALIVGVIFTFAYLFMFKALGENEATRITPFMGGLQPIFVFVLAWIFLGESLGILAIVAFFILVVGTIILSRQGGQSAKAQKISRRSYVYATIATILFAIAYTASKYVYNEDGFITGFVWTRIGTFLGAMLLLLSHKNLTDIMSTLRTPKRQSKTGLLFAMGQTAGALSFVLVSYAVSISDSVAIVNASRGLEYVFLLLILIILSKRYPKVLSEKMTGKIIFQKIIATTFIIVGLIILAFAS